LHGWLIDTLAVLLAAALLRRGIQYASPVDLLAASLLLGILNAVLRPVLTLLTLPLVLVTLGLFRFVINALLLLLVGWLLSPRFSVHGFWPAFWGALIISLASSILNALTGTHRVHIRWRRGPRRPGDDPGGPVIDV
jgi:putative membrane protein